MNTSKNLQMLLSRRGQPATFTKHTQSAYNPSTGTFETAPETEQYKVNCYFADYKTSESDSISTGTRTVLVSPLDSYQRFVPKPTAKDSITSVQGTAKVMGSQELYNGSTLVCYICQVSE